MKTIQYFICATFLLIICCKCKSPCDKDHLKQSATVITEVSPDESSILESEGNPDVMIFIGDNTQDSTSLEAYANSFLILGFDVLFSKNNLKTDSTRTRFVKSSIEFLRGKGYKNNKIVVYGKGSSCYASCTALQDERVRGLILESVSESNFDFLLHDINGVKGKILIIQGDRDNNWEKSIQLYKQITGVPKQIFIFPSITQNDIYYDPEFKEIAEFFLTENRSKHVEGRSFKPW